MEEGSGGEQTSKEALMHESPRRIRGLSGAKQRDLGKRAEKKVNPVKSPVKVNRVIWITFF